MKVKNIFTPFSHLKKFAILKELIKAYVLDDQQDSQRDDLYQRVVTLEKGNKVRKRLSLTKKLGLCLIGSQINRSLINPT